jgi:4-amino-4-deoxy-L-arabinose transferase-like glycosyltransferase
MKEDGRKVLGCARSADMLSVARWLVLLLILLAGAWLRFGNIDQVDFQWDQAEFSRWALRTARDGRFSWTGPISSSGVDTFHVAVILLAIPYSISLSPVVATAFVAALNLATVAGWYFVARRWLREPGALVATALFAVAPWAVVYSRKIWPSNLLPPFVLIHALTGWLAFARGRRWALPLHAVAAAVAVQVHVSAVLMLGVSVAWAIVFVKRIDWRVALASVVLAGLLFVPYLTVDAGKDWVNVRRVLQVVGLPANTSVDSWVSTWVNTTGQGLGVLIGADRYGEFLAETPNARWLFVLGGLLAGGALLLALVTAARTALRRSRPKSEVPLLAAIWLLVPALLLTRSSIPPAPHYYVVTMPAQFLLIGWGASLAWRQKRIPPVIARTVAAVAVVAVAAAQAYEIHSVLRYVETHDTLGGYGIPVSYEIRAAETAKQLLEEHDASEVIMLSNGDEPRKYEMPAVADILLYGLSHRAVDVRNALLFPAEAAVYWGACDTSEVQVIDRLLDEVQGASIPLREGVRPFRFYLWEGGRPELPGMIEVDAGSWTNGARLAGYLLEGEPEPGATVRWTLVWEPLSTPDEDVYYHWFSHIVDEAGRMCAQADGPSLLPAYWRPGDTVLNWFEMEIAAETPTGDYMVRVGMYYYPSLERIPVLAGSGDGVQDWLTLGPVAAGP